MRTIATIISIIGHPLLTIPLFILVVMFGEKADAASVFIALLIIGGVFIPVIIWNYIKTKNGSYTNFDVSDKHQRKSLFWFAIPLLSVVTVILFLTRQPRNLCLSVLLALILVIVSQAINLFIKSSLHVSLNIYLSALIMTQNLKFGLFALIFTGLIGWSRVKLGRHTVQEVIWGLFTGAVFSVLMLTIEGYVK